MATKIGGDTQNPVRSAGHRMVKARQNVSYRQRRTHLVRRKASVRPRRKYRNARYALALLGRLIQRRIARRVASGTTNETTVVCRPQRAAGSRHSALVLVGKLLKRRLQKCSLFTKGVNLVRRLSYCSLTALSECSLATSSHRSVTEKGRKLSAEMLSYGPSVAGTYESNVTSPPLTAAVRVADTVTRLTRLTGPLVDCNVNAIKTDLEGSSVHKLLRSSLTSKTGRAGGRRKLVARSIGRPKLTQRIRPRNKKFGLLDQTSKKLKYLRKKHSKLRRQGQHQNKSPYVAREKGSVQMRKVPDKKTCPVEKKMPQTRSAHTTHHQDMTLPNQETAGLWLQTSFNPHQLRGKSQEPDITPRKKCGKKRRVKQKKNNLMDLFEAGPSFGNSCENKEIKGRLRRKNSKSNGPNSETGKSGSVSQPSAASYPCLKRCSTENLEWPSLSESGRQKGLTKETAKELVISKQSGSVMKMTRKRWADIVASRTKGECSSQDVISKSVTPQRTWAAVAAKPQVSTAAEAGTTNSVAGNDANEPCPSPKSKSSSCASLNNSKLKRKSGSRLAYTDRLWADGMKGKGKPQSHKFYRKYFSEGGDRCKKREKIRTRRNRVKQRSDEEKSLVPSRDPERGQEKGEAEEPSGSGGEISGKLRSAEGESERRQEWRIDQMSVVYTQPVGPVISLNEPRATSARVTHGVNKCNNRTVTPSNTRATLHRMATRSTTREQEDDSGMDLCDRLSSISFQSSNGSDDKTAGHFSSNKKRGNQIPRQKMPKPKNVITLPPYHREAGKQCPEEREPCKQKKISSRYRALLRGESGRLGAKTVTEITTRSKRTDSLKQDKVVTRAMQKHQRLQKQETQHNNQRPPSASTEDSSKLSPPVQQRVTRSSRPANVRNTIVLSSEGSSCQSDKDDPECSAKDNSRSNNSLASLEWGSAPNSSVVPRRRAELKNPVYARSAPELAKRHNNICLELHAAHPENLDIGWWHAYLVQVTDPRPAGEQQATAQGIATTSSQS